MSEQVVDRASNRRRIAFHEAGHAIAAWKLVVRVERILFRFDDDGGADDGGGFESGPRDHLNPIDQVAVVVAGRYGAALSGIPVSDDHYSTRKDDADALQIAMRACPGDNEAGERIYRAGEERAWAILHKHADLVALVAEATPMFRAALASVEAHSPRLSI
jgi:hypothetical protein